MDTSQTSAQMSHHQEILTVDFGASVCVAGEANLFSGPPFPVTQSQRPGADQKISRSNVALKKRVKPVNSR